jgi:TIR domain
MHKVFINYRTGDGEEAATLLADDLSRRFGSDEIFRATKSIEPGTAFPETLVTAVRGSAVLLAVMGPDWARHPGLSDEADWVRREILLAREYAVRVIPVLKGRRTERLNPRDLPSGLEWLADVQSLRLDVREHEVHLPNIAAKLRELVPALKEREDPPATDAVANSVGEVSGTAIQSGTINGDVSTVTGNQGTLHNGKGDINQHSPTISGPGGAYVAGDNHGGISHRFGPQDDNR